MKVLIAVVALAIFSGQAFAEPEPFKQAKTAVSTMITYLTEGKTVNDINDESARKGRTGEIAVILNTIACKINAIKPNDIKDKAAFGKVTTDLHDRQNALESYRTTTPKDMAAKTKVIDQEVAKWNTIVANLKKAHP